MPASSPKTLDSVLAGITKDFGTGSVMSLADAPQVVDAISTGSIALNTALGVGGYPRGRIIEIYGPESSGKSTLAQAAVAQAQKLGLICAYIDAEHALDPDYAAAMGVDVDRLLVSQPDFGEQGLEIADRLAASGHVGLIVVDSVAALVPKAELDGDMGDVHVGLQARMMSQALRKMTGHLAAANCSCIFINQMREKVGVFFGNPETTSGGKALKFYSSVRLDVRRIETLKDGTESIGNRLRVKAVKNKVAPPFRVAEMDLLFGQGINREGEIIDLGVQAGVVKKSGAWYTYDGSQLGQGKENARSFLTQHPDVASSIEAAIAAAGPQAVAGKAHTRDYPEAGRGRVGAETSLEDLPIG